MNTEPDDSWQWIVFWICATAVLLAVIGVCFFAIYSYDKRMTLAIEHGYVIDSVETTGYKPLPK